MGKGPGGVLVRRLLLPAALLPAVLGYAALEGQRAGLYGFEEALALFASSIVVLYGALIVFTARALERIDTQRRAGEARERAVIAAALDCIITIDARGRVLDFNPAAERVFGYSRAQAVGREMGALIVPPRLRDAHRGGLARFAETGETNIVGKRLELTAMRADGSEFPVEVEVSRLRQSGEAAFVGQVRDISERVAAHQTTSRLAAVVESSRDAIVAAELDGTITAWNAAAERIYGYPADEVIERSVSLLLPDESMGDLPRLLERLRAGESFDRDALHLRRNGERVHVSLTVFPILGRSGEPIAAAMIVRDLTERRSLEEQLRQAQKMEAIGHLAGGVAHDFNNLLTVISGFAQVARRRIGAGPGGPELGEIDKAARRAAELTHQLLAFSRRQLLDPVALDLNEVVNGLLPMLGRLIGEDVQIGVLAEDELSPALADRGQVEQVILNLVVNARDAMPRGGTITIEIRSAMLDEEYAREHVDVEPGAYVCMTVTDTGPGIEPAILEHIFEPFFTTKEVGRGTGLGLATVHGIVAQSGGHVSVHSERGLGTTFKVYFPAAAAQPSTPIAETYEPHALRGSETILLCEDEDAVRHYIRTVLVDSGYRVLEAEHPKAAIELARTTQWSFHALVTDVVMPGMSGPDLAERLSRSFPGLRVLYVSGYTAEALTSRGIEPGRAFVEKPFEPVDLLRALRSLLDGPEARGPVRGAAGQWEE